MCYDIPFVVRFCLSFCILFMSCISYHVIMCIAFAYVFVSCVRAFSPLFVLQSGTPTCTGTPPLVSFRERVLNILGMDRGLPNGLGTPPVDHLSSFVPFGGRLTLQRVTGSPQRPFVCCSQTPPKQLITHLIPLHALGRSTMIVWAKTALHLESPSSLCLYKHLPLRNPGSKP